MRERLNSEAEILLRLVSTATGFPDTRSPNIRNAPNTPNWTLILNGQKNIECALKTYVPRCPDFGQFCSTTSRFQYTGLSKIGNFGMHWMTSKWPWTLITVKSTWHTVQPFSRYKVVKIGKIGMRRMTPDWLWNRNSLKYLIYPN